MDQILRCPTSFPSKVCHGASTFPEVPVIRTKTILLERGIVWGWPSGHMGTTSALVTTLTHYYPEKIWIKWMGFSSLAYMLLTVSAHDTGQMHWFSDGAAGALDAIGSTVGTNQRARIGGNEVQAEGQVVLPLISPQASGVQLVWSY